MFIDIEPSQYPLERKLWIRHFNGLLETGKINPDILGHLDSYQQFAVNHYQEHYVLITLMLLTFHDHYFLV